MSAEKKHVQALETLNMLVNGIGGIDAKIIELVHASHFLVDDLESGFSFQRGQDIGDGGVQLVFQKEGIDATLWLMGKIYRDVRDLLEVITQVRLVIDELDLSPPVAAVPSMERAAV